VGRMRERGEEEREYEGEKKIIYRVPFKMKKNNRNLC